MCVHVNNRVINNTASGNCGSRQWQNGAERKTMATYLQANGYATFYGGKYLNQVNISLKNLKDLKLKFVQILFVFCPLFSAGGCLNIYLPRGWECVWRYRIIIYSSVWWETMTKWRQMRQVQSETFKFLFFLVSYFFKKGRISIQVSLRVLFEIVTLLSFKLSGDVSCSVSKKIRTSLFFLFYKL